MRKKLFFAVIPVIALVFVLGLAGCSGDIDENLVGKWYVTEDADAGTIPGYEFTGDGKLFIEGAKELGITYTAGGGKITTVRNGEKWGKADYSISSNRLTLSNVGSSELKAGTYYKR